uniref:Uncharacterized protein n=1 Tax=Neobodo designis TaxID=312471 RepID=A0A7S1KZ89_NEODS|mmetsp:Transcript_11657/g.36208  ORF Transcript_11657/g.36208 Transcript_11657/m.36208 type:complete len:1109 (+) Transcript_11657:162-3488(+)|eukprot:CAMPEP_0174852074 /NCGR_PEP_ID=MMETSP1114-20130205/25167_1 /TAXON_ID=312471 /ORGANISM="Neobodo designis, Strain CCAP 1951/1" /LENGTH=1108 /DNA_ID=CAMNT_0016086651 /DNA_START=161 /DNA_END=3487 /DNA_ORIENTATION=+
MSAGRRTLSLDQSREDAVACLRRAREHVEQYIVVIGGVEAEQCRLQSRFDDLIDMIDKICEDRAVDTADAAVLFAASPVPIACVVKLLHPEGTDGDCAPVVDRESPCTLCWPVQNALGGDYNVEDLGDTATGAVSFDTVDFMVQVGLLRPYGTDQHDKSKITVANRAAFEARPPPTRDLLRALSTAHRGRPQALGNKDSLAHLFLFLRLVCAVDLKSRHAFGASITTREVEGGGDFRAYGPHHPSSLLAALAERFQATVPFSDRRDDPEAALFEYAIKHATQWWPFFLAERTTWTLAPMFHLSRMLWRQEVAMKCRDPVHGRWREVLVNAFGPRTGHALADVALVRGSDRVKLPLRVRTHDSPLWHLLEPSGTNVRVTACVRWILDRFLDGHASVHAEVNLTGGTHFRLRAVSQGGDTTLLEVTSLASLYAMLRCGIAVMSEPLVFHASTSPRVRVHLYASPAMSVFTALRTMAWLEARGIGRDPGTPPLAFTPAAVAAHLQRVCQPVPEPDVAALLDKMACKWCNVARGAQPETFRAVHDIDAIRAVIGDTAPGECFEAIVADESYTLEQRLAMAAADFNVDAGPAPTDGATFIRVRAAVLLPANSERDDENPAGVEGAAAATAAAATDSSDDDLMADGSTRQRRAAQRPAAAKHAKKKKTAASRPVNDQATRDRGAKELAEAVAAARNTAAAEHWKGVLPAQVGSILSRLGFLPNKKLSALRKAVKDRAIKAGLVVELDSAGTLTTPGDPLIAQRAAEAAAVAQSSHADGADVDVGSHAVDVDDVPADEDATRGAPSLQANSCATSGVRDTAGDDADVDVGPHALNEMLFGGADSAGAGIGEAATTPGTASPQATSRATSGIPAVAGDTDAANDGSDEDDSGHTDTASDAGHVTATDDEDEALSLPHLDGPSDHDDDGTSLAAPTKKSLRRGRRSTSTAAAPSTAADTATTNGAAATGQSADNASDGHRIPQEHAGAVLTELLRAAEESLRHDKEMARHFNERARRQRRRIETIKALMADGGARGTREEANPARERVPQAPRHEPLHLDPEVAAAAATTAGGVSASASPAGATTPAAPPQFSRHNIPYDLEPCDWDYGTTGPAGQD